MQMAGQIISRSVDFTSTPRNAAGAANATAPPTESTQPNLSTNQTTGQNSQARGNTQTNPTTSTQTRSTSRPHVHLSSHAMQGFDPFLPCNSHHVTPRRRVQQSRSAPPNNNTSRPTPQNTANANQFNPIYNIVHGILNSFQNAYRPRNQQPNTAVPPQSQTTVGGANVDSGVIQRTALPFSFLPFLQIMVTIF